MERNTPEDDGGAADAILDNVAANVGVASTLNTSMSILTDDATYVILYNTGTTPISIATSSNIVVQEEGGYVSATKGLMRKGAENPASVSITPTADDNKIYTVSINGTKYSYASDANGTAEEIVAGLKAAIDVANLSEGSSTTTLDLTATSGTFDIAVTQPDIAYKSIAATVTAGVGVIVATDTFTTTITPTGGVATPYVATAQAGAVAVADISDDILDTLTDGVDNDDAAFTAATDYISTINGLDLHLSFAAGVTTMIVPSGYTVAGAYANPATGGAGTYTLVETPIPVTDDGIMAISAVAATSALAYNSQTTSNNLTGAGGTYVPADNLPVRMSITAASQKDFEALSNLSLYYENNTTPVLTTSGTEATAPVDAYGRANFSNLQLSIPKSTDVYISAVADFNKISSSSSDTARSGMVLDAVLAFNDSDGFDIKGESSGSTYTAGAGGKIYIEESQTRLVTKQGKEQFVLNNSMQAKLGAQVSALTATETTGLKFTLTPGTSKESYLKSVIVDVSASIAANGGGVDGFCQLALVGKKSGKIAVVDFAATAVVGGRYVLYVDKYSADGGDSYIDCTAALGCANASDTTSNRDVIASAGEEYTIQMELGTGAACAAADIATDDTVTLTVMAGGSAPGYNNQDAITWQDYGVTNSDGVNVLWVENADSKDRLTNSLKAL